MFQKADSHEKQKQIYLTNDRVRDVKKRANAKIRSCADFLEVILYFIILVIDRTSLIFLLLTTFCAFKLTLTQVMSTHIRAKII